MKVYKEKLLVELKAYIEVYGLLDLLEHLAKSATIVSDEQPGPFKNNQLDRCASEIAECSLTCERIALGEV